ncbi:MAG: rane protein [Candidatus Nomurabacteria bacterium]|nr:rane protein [Candidatus Nomurabacteria bacterium]
MNKIGEKRIFITYEIALLIKAIQAFLEIIIGIVFCIISTATIKAFMLFIAYGELAESPNNIISHILVQSAYQLSPTEKIFIIWYLLLHGIIKLILIGGLFLNKSWAYTASVIGLGSLILYQLYNLIVHYSLFLLVLTIIDIIILWLIIRESRIKKQRYS